MDSVTAYFPFTFNLLLAFSHLLGVVLFREVSLGTMASDWSQFFLCLTRNKSINKMQFL